MVYERRTISAVVFLHICLVAQAQYYVINELGTLGGSSSIALGLNDSGEVVGASLTPSGQAHAFVWSWEKGLEDLSSGSGETTASFLPV